MATGLMLVLALVSAPASGDLPPWNDGELLVRSSEKIANERCRRDVGLFLEDLGRLRLWATESELVMVSVDFNFFNIRLKCSTRLQSYQAESSLVQLMEWGISTSALK